MSAYRFAFLFDFLGFKEKITPALNALINGSSNELEQIAIQLVKDNSKIWDFVGYSRVPLYDDDSEKGIDDVINAGVLPWLLLVISNYCSRIDHRVDFNILSQAGIDEMTIDMLKDPKPLGDLLINVAPSIVPTNYVDGNFNINNCPLGWLGINDIERIKITVQSNIEQTNIHDYDDLLTMLNNAINSKKALILGFWFN